MRESAACSSTSQAPLKSHQRVEAKTASNSASASARKSSRDTPTVHASQRVCGCFSRTAAPSRRHTCAGTACGESKRKPPMPASAITLNSRAHHCVS